MHFQELPDDIRLKILRYDQYGLCAASKETLATCDQFWVDAVATEKNYWETQYTVNGVTGVPRDTVRKDMRKFDKCREGFARILDLIRRRDGVKLEEDKIPKDVPLRKAYEHLVGARLWAPRHWQANRQAFADEHELKLAFYDLKGWPTSTTSRYSVWRTGSVDYNKRDESFTVGRIRL